MEPRRTSGGRYHTVTTSWEYVWVGTDLARAKPALEFGTQQYAKGSLITHHTYTHQSQPI